VYTKKKSFEKESKNKLYILEREPVCRKEEEIKQRLHV
jgi:hypothetical protein